MIGLGEFAFDPIRCAAELDDFARLLASPPTLPERRVLLPCFRARPHLTALLGSYHPRMAALDLLAYELRLFGANAADVVVGDREQRAYCFIEFAAGLPRRIFVRTASGASRWSHRLERGFSQICDWFWKLDDLRGTAAFVELFGAPSIDVTAVLVIGRDAGLPEADRERLRWRWQHVLIDSQQVYCCTFGQLERDLRRRFAVLAGAGRRT